jgi:DNA mismatch endonuclease (patch repair protein)
MADIFSKDERSAIMARIRGAHTRPEKTVRTFLRKSGFRLRLNAALFPGKPDILIPECRTAVFVNGCFWHGHRGCKRGELPATRTDFWRRKIAGNVRRDRRNKAALKKLGWQVVTIWQCQLTSRKIAGRFRYLLARLRAQTDGVSLR